MKNLLVFDIDGTLHHRKKGIPNSTIEAIKKLSENNKNILAIASGRATYNIDVLDEIINYFDYIVGANGQIVMKEEKVIYSNPIDKKEVNNLIECVNYNKKLIALISKDRTIYSRENFISKKLINNHHKRKKNTPKPIIRKYYHKKNDIYQLMLIASGKFAIEIQKDFPELRFVSSGLFSYDIIPNSVSKVSGIEKVKEDIGEEVITYTFGNGYNDIEMIKYADYGVAMKNSPAALKEVADYVTAGVRDSGISKALKLFKLI